MLFRSWKEKVRNGEAQSQVAAVRIGRRDGYKDSLGVRINDLVMEQMITSRDERRV